MVAAAKVAAQPAAESEVAVDLMHLAQMTLGEPGLEREVLALFIRQAQLLLPRIRCGTGPIAAAGAHTLKGSALGIGAFAVARAAEAVERAGEAELQRAIDQLDDALAEASAEIAGLLRQAAQA